LYDSNISERRKDAFHEYGLWKIDCSEAFPEVPPVRKALVYLSAFLGSLIAHPARLLPQTLMHAREPGGTVHLIGNDSAVLDAEEPRKDLPCTVTPVKPVLGFDLRFHSGYDIATPLRELAGEGDTLTVVFRVTASGAPDSPAYFFQRFSVPDIEADASGDAYLDGGFEIGEGSYHIDWMMRDRMERVCSSGWDVTAALAAKDQNMKLTIARNAIDASDPEFFREEPPVNRLKNEALKVKVLLNFAPQHGNAASMQPVDTGALVSILRSISREPRICTFSVVAFNMTEQRVIYRQEEADRIDFPGLGKALSSVKLGMVDYRALADPHSGSAFLSKLVFDELGNNKADAVIFAGPKVGLDDNVPPDSLKELPSVPYPVFYMNYNLSPAQNPWRDPIGNVVKHLRGYEYTISRPRDLWNSWSDIMSRIVKLKLVASVATSSQ
jgi:hypothetical protein